MADIDRRLAAILAADIAGYSRLMGADETGTFQRVADLRRRVIEPTVRRHGGRIVKTTGDGFLAEFPSAAAAVRTAIEIQAAVAADAGPIQFRIGVNLGDIIRDRGDVFGDGVNVAARLEQLAAPGEVYVSQAVCDQVRDRLALEIEALGPQTVKNIARPVEVFRLRAGPGYRADAPLSRRPAARRWAMLGATAALAVAALVAGLALLRPSPRPADDRAERLDAAAPTAPRLSIAVMPFANLSGRPEDDAFVDGITEDLITDLSRISGAFVIARNSSFAYKGRAVDLRQAGRELGVANLLEGSIRHVGDQLRINVQLVDAEGGAQSWADRFDIPVADRFRLQDEITGRIARTLNLELKESVSRRAARGRSQNLGAEDLATQGMAILFNKPQTRDTNEEARPILERALALDPNNAEAWAGMAYVHMRGATYGWSASRPESIQAALAAGERAVALDPGSTDAHYVLGYAAHFNNEFERARRLFERCLELNPNYAPAYFWLGIVETFDGNPAAAVGLIERAFRLSPREGLAGVWRSNLAVAYLLLGNDAAAVREARTGTTDNPRHPMNYAVMAAALAHLGRADEARAALERFTANGGARSLAQMKRIGRPSAEIYAQRFARYLEGLRKAGMPEGEP
ncbi:MAG: adenylate/guanylate cyclase domain-containing protein [Rhodospirillales bacterium]|nr:adenylate/guanylate cyclase domain-containing protein [Rhodospirillales bacterium]